MNESLEKLYAIGKKESRKVIGLMSGTSLDGLDVALCEIQGNGINTKLYVLKFETINYEEEFKDEIRTVFSKKTIDLEKLCLLNEWVATEHAAIVNTCLKNWNFSKENIDIIASHGQTIYHAPKYVHKNPKFGNATLQIGDGDHIAVNTGIITLSDFRQKHIAAGGEGAPLAAYGDFILFSEKEHDVILLNIGGIANFTYLPAGVLFENVICSDIGPGNTLMDTYIQKHFPGKHYDNDAIVAKQGSIHNELLSALKRNAFFDLPFAKTTGPELFNMDYLERAMTKTGTLNLSVPDVMATLNEFTAITICEAINKLSSDSNCKIYASGGGIHNQLLMDNIRNHISSIPIYSTKEKNIDPNAKEAVLFAVLANECVAGNGEKFGKGTNYFPPVTMGKISFPK